MTDKTKQADEPFMEFPNFDAAFCWASENTDIQDGFSGSANEDAFYEIMGEAERRAEPQKDGSKVYEHLTFVPPSKTNG